MCMLKAENVAIAIGNKNILQEVNISLLKGKRTAIIGPNGSGKSTLLKALAGILYPTRGKIFFDGKDIHSYSKKKLAQQLAVLPQGSVVPNDLTVGELVDYGRFPHRKWWKSDYSEDKKVVEWALKQAGLEQLKERLISTLSGGERQRAWIAMALAQEPKVLLLDEPTTYLDIAHQLEIMKIITELNKKNEISVVMVLHDINHARQYADEIIVVKSGQIVGQGIPEDVLTIKLLADVFNVTAEKFANQKGQSVLIPTKLIK